MDHIAQNNCKDIKGEKQRKRTKTKVALGSHIARYEACLMILLTFL